jgi:hypothetical protein
VVKKDGAKDENNNKRGTRKRIREEIHDFVSPSDGERHSMTDKLRIGVDRDISG